MCLTVGHQKQELLQIPVRNWARLYDDWGIEGLKHSYANKEWMAKEGFGPVAKVLAGRSVRDEAFEKNLNLEGLVFHSDQGRQYQMKQYGERLRERGNRLIHVPQGQPHRGPRHGDVLRHAKREMFYGHESDFRTFERLKRAVAEYIDYHNDKRINGRTKWIPPAKCMEASMPTLWHNPISESRKVGTFHNNRICLVIYIFFAYAYVKIE